MKRIFLTLLLASLPAVASQAAVIKDIILPSKAMGQDMPLKIVLPNSYPDPETKTTAQIGRRYPVVYLLHGHGDNQTGWPTKTPLSELSDKEEIIFVCPNGKTSWYFDSKTDPKEKMETHIIQEILPFIDENFLTIPRRKGRAITGNSMGGHGALYLGARHPDLFGAAGSLSGGVDFTPFPENWNIKNNLGPYNDNKELWRKHTVLYLLPKVKKKRPRLIISCGSEDFFLNVNKKLDQALTEAGYKHTFLITPGSHNWNYWKEAIRPQIDFFSEYFRAPGTNVKLPPLYPTRHPQDQPAAPSGKN